MLGGGQLLNKTITAADLPSDGSYGLIELEFVNPNVDRWRTPLLFNAISSGQSQIWADYVLFEPVWFYGWGLPYIFVGLITLGAGLAWWWGRRDHAVTAMTDSVRLPQLSALAGWGMSALLLVGGFGYLTNQSDIQRRTYDAAHLMHLTGQTIADSETETGQAWLVDPATDAPQKATYGPFDFYDAGQYHVTFRMKLPTAVEGDQEVALLQVNATANFEPVLTQPLRSTNFTQPDMYHDFVLTVTNPRRQALSFDVHYLGVAPLAIESVTISKIGEMR
jgi:hypothetical protein